MTPRRLEVDPATLRALAHPLRVAILRVLELRGRASVTGLAAELGESTASVSYHLRQLARHGVVEEDVVEEDDGEPAAARAVGRPPRFWRMAVDELHFDAVALNRDPGGRDAWELLAGESVATRARRLADWYAAWSGWPEEWQRAASDDDAVLTLDPAAARALADELAALVARYRQLRPGEGARRVDVQYAVFPLPDDRLPDDGPA